MPVDASHPLARSLARNVGSAVRAVRERRGYSQIELAERVGVSMQTISNIERGEGTSLAVLAVLAHALAVHVSELIDEDDSEIGRSFEEEVAPMAAMLDQEDRDLLVAILRLLVERTQAAEAALRRAREDLAMVTVRKSTGRRRGSTVPVVPAKKKAGA